MVASILVPGSLRHPHSGSRARDQWDNRSLDSRLSAIGKPPPPPPQPRLPSMPGGGAYPPSQPRPHSQGPTGARGPPPTRLSQPQLQQMEMCRLCKELDFGPTNFEPCDLEYCPDLIQFQGQRPPSSLPRGMTPSDFVDFGPPPLTSATSYYPSVVERSRLLRNQVSQQVRHKKHLRCVCRTTTQCANVCHPGVACQVKARPLRP